MRSRFLNPLIALVTATATIAVFASATPMPVAGATGAGATAAGAAAAGREGPAATVEVGTSVAFPGRDPAVEITGGPAARDHPKAPSSAPPPCVEFEAVHVDFGFGAYILFVCSVHAICGAERIDDPSTGHLSGGGSGAYVEYLAQRLGEVSVPGVVDLDAAAHSRALLASALGPPPTPEALAVFRWCRRSDNLQFLDDGGALSAAFGWDTTVTTEYPLATARDQLYDEVYRRIHLYRPEVDAIPPLATGRTFVNFPTWLWVEDPEVEVSVHGVSDLDLVRVEMRAVLETVTWDFGDTELTCTPGDMVRYEPALDPFADRPRCSHTFDATGDLHLASTLSYRIETRIATRDHTGVDFPDTPWEPHVDHASIDVTTVVGHHEVHELVSVVVNEEFD